MKIVRVKVKKTKAIATNGKLSGLDQETLKKQIAEHKAQLKSDTLNREYGLLKALNHMLGTSIKFEDFDTIGYTYYPERHSVALRCPTHKFFRVFNMDELLAEFKLWPTMLVDFLQTNGAVEYTKAGKKIEPPPTYKGIPGFFHQEKPKKEKYVMKEDGFWGMVPDESSAKSKPGKVLIKRRIPKEK